MARQRQQTTLPPLLLLAFSLLLLLLLLPLGTDAFGPPFPAAHSAIAPRSRRSGSGTRMLLDLFQSRKTAAGPSAAERARLKKAVFESIQGSDMGFIKGPKNEDRKKTIAALRALAEASPTRDSAVSPKAEGCWDLLWTTEDEIHAFRKGGLLGLGCEAVYQETNQQAKRLENVIDFAGGSYLRITSELKPDAEGPRVYFSWIKARVCYRGFELPLPRFVQNAWYENIYLDDDIRVVMDIRGNYLIVKRVKSPARTVAA